jgi:hypothetical protein
MVNDALSYKTISTVMETWEEARRTPAFEENLGMKTILKYVMMMLKRKTRRAISPKDHHF